MGYTDYEITCRDCDNNFTFTAGEQKFYDEKNFSAPVRCEACRKARKVQTTY